MIGRWKQSSNAARKASLQCQVISLPVTLPPNWNDKGDFPESTDVVDTAAVALTFALFRRGACGIRQYVSLCSSPSPGYSGSSLLLPPFSLCNDVIENVAEMLLNMTPPLPPFPMT